MKGNYSAVLQKYFRIFGEFEFSTLLILQGCKKVDPCAYLLGPNGNGRLLTSKPKIDLHRNLIVLSMSKREPIQLPDDFHIIVSFRDLRGSCQVQRLFTLSEFKEECKLSRMGAVNIWDFMQDVAEFLDFGVDLDIQLGFQTTLDCC